MADIYVYDKSAQDTGTTGLVGALIPISCEHEEIGNGMSSVTLTHFSLMAFRLHAYQSRCALQKMCETDAMTGVNNKTTFQYRVESYLQAVYRSAVVALAVCDLDDFKGVNDKHGHRIGDQVLKAFAARMHKIADDDPNTIIGRFGGDEFVIFFKDGRNEKRILKALRALCKIDGFDFPVTCSIGVAFSGSDVVLFDKLFDRADQNAYHAKENVSERIFASKMDDP